MSATQHRNYNKSGDIIDDNDTDDDGRDGDDGRKKTYGGCKWRIPALAT